MVPGLSSSSSGSSSTSKTPSKHESHSSSSSSTSSSSPTVSENQTRDREDRNSSDISPVQVSNSVDGRSGQPDETTIERGDSLNSEITRFSSFNFNDPALTPVLLMKYLQSPLQRDVRIWVSTVFILISQKDEIARSVRGLKIQGPRAEDAMAEPYLVLKN